MTPLHEKLLLIILLLFIINFFGTIGYMYIEDMSFLDTVYMTVITLGTVGFKEVVVEKNIETITEMYNILYIIGDAI